MNYGRVEKPRNAKTHEDVEHVAPDGVGDGHVTVPLLDDGDAGERVRNADPGGDEGQAHHGVGDAHGEPDHRDHPDHHVGVDRNPDYRAEEGQDVGVCPGLLPAVGDRDVGQEVERQHDVVLEDGEAPVLRPRERALQVLLLGDGSLRNVGVGLGLVPELGILDGLEGDAAAPILSGRLVHGLVVAGGLGISSSLLRRRPRFRNGQLFIRPSFEPRIEGHGHAIDDIEDEKYERLGPAKYKQTSCWGLVCF